MSYFIVRIEFSPLGLINISNGHYFTLEITDNDQLVVTSDIFMSFVPVEWAIGKGAIIRGELNF